MKLAQALAERADLQKRIAQLRARLLRNAKVQEGETPAEQPEALFDELDALVAQLEGLITRINATNAATLENGETLTALLARRDCLALKAAATRDFLDEASALVTRGTVGEIRIHSTVQVAALQKKADALSKQLRELDMRIQSLNWTVELTESL